MIWLNTNGEGTYKGKRISIPDILEIIEKDPYNNELIGETTVLEIDCGDHTEEKVIKIRAKDRMDDNKRIKEIKRLKENMPDIAKEMAKVYKDHPEIILDNFYVDDLTDKQLDDLEFAIKTEKAYRRYEKRRI